MPRQPLTVAGGGSLDLWVRVPRVEQPGAFRSVRWIFASFYLLVVLIHEDDAGVIILQVFWGELGITDDDHQGVFDASVTVVKDTACQDNP